MIVFLFFIKIVLFGKIINILGLLFLLLDEILEVFKF